MNEVNVSIDPGVPLGYAVWETKTWGKLCAPLATGVAGPIGLPKTATYIERLQRTVTRLILEMEHQFHFNMMELPIRNIYIEWPSFFGGSARGYASAARDDIVKLSIATGYIIAWLEKCRGGRPGEIIPVPVRNWKGQLPKDVVIQRIKKLLGTAACYRLGVKTHAYDAIGIGLYAKGHFQ